MNQIVLVSACNLLDAAEVTRVDRAELDIFLLPMRLNRGHIVGEVAEGESAEAARVGGEHGGGKDAGFKSASGEDGERNGQRALTNTGYILNCQNFFIGHLKFLLAILFDLLYDISDDIKMVRNGENYITR